MYRFLPVITVNAKICFSLRIFSSCLLIDIMLLMMGILIPMSFTFRTSKHGIPRPPLPPSLSQQKIMTVVMYHVQYLAPSNSGSVFLNSNVCQGTLLVFPGSNVYRGTFLVFPYSNISWGTLLVFPDTNLCSKILLHTILWGKCQTN